MEVASHDGASNGLISLQLIGHDVTADNEGCETNSMKVYYAYRFEDNGRDDGDGPSYNTSTRGDDGTDRTPVMCLLGVIPVRCQEDVVTVVTIEPILRERFEIAIRNQYVIEPRRHLKPLRIGEVVRAACYHDSPRLAHEGSSVDSVPFARV